MNDINSVIPPISSEVFSAKFISALNVIYTAITPIIMPAALIGLVLSVLIIIAGSITCSKKIKEVGWGGIMSLVFAVGLFYLIPLLLGLFKNATVPLKL